MSAVNMFDMNSGNIVRFLFSNAKPCVSAEYGII